MMVTREPGGRAAGDAAVRLYAELLSVLQQQRGPVPQTPASLQPAWDVMKGGMNRQRVAEALKLFQAALDAAPNDPAAEMGVAYCLAMNLMNRWSQDSDTDFMLALKYLEHVIEQMPRYQLAHLTVGMVYKARRDYAHALAAWSAALAINPREASTHSQVAHVNLLLGNIREGLEHADLSLRLNPNSHVVDRVHFYIGMGRLMAGDYQLAEQSLAKAVAINPHLPDVYVWRVSALALSGRQQEAEALYAETMKRFPWWNVDHHLTQVVDPRIMERFSTGLAMVARTGN
jgi:tetratricopeptide (TPR) repeat protein